MFFHKKRTDIDKYTYVIIIVINSINSSLKIVIISQNLTERRCHIRKIKIYRSINGNNTVNNMIMTV